MRQFEHFPNLVTMFFTRARDGGDKPFLWRKREGGWQALSWAEVARQVASLAAGLKALGLKPGDRVMLVSENRPEWCIADLAIMAAGGVTVPTYTTNTERDHLHILENSGAVAVIVSTEKLSRTLLPAILRSNTTRDVISMEALRVPQAGEIGFHRWDELVATPADLPATEEAAGRIGSGCRRMAACTPIARNTHSHGCRANNLPSSVGIERFT